MGGGRRTAPVDERTEPAEELALAAVEEEEAVETAVCGAGDDATGCGGFICG